jgi:pimeloyl-ACP methyl ester carboxylesterase/DNA-binding CsgD family transcriptional regulator
MQAGLAVIGTCYALSARQLAMLDALVATGTVRDAAVRIGVSYISARNLLAELKEKLGVATVPMMIGLALDLVSAGGDDSITSLDRHDLFSLSERQFTIARRLGVSKSRLELAAALGVSPPVIDAELKEIYLILGVRTAGELVRLVDGFEARTVQRGHAAGAPDIEHSLPSATVMHGHRAIAYSDYGPVSGEPVLVLHSTITARAPPTRLVAALQSAGYRPLAMDRPGFGGTDMAQDASADPYVPAAHDVAALCAALGLASLHVIARGSGQAAVRLAQLYPALLRRVVLVNPTPAIAHTPTDRGPLGAVKRMFGRRPWAVEAMIRMLAAYATPQRMHDGMLRSFRDSPPDLALVRDDPQFLTDYLRATQGFAHGRLAGYVAEQAAWGAGYDVQPLPGMTSWRILQGVDFILHEPARATAYWRQRLPDTPVHWVAGAGQMLAYSHADHVVAALAADETSVTTIHSGMERIA